MALYLVQHGKSEPKEIDPEQGLSREGVGEVQRIAEVARAYGIQVAQIRHSTKVRAKQTAQILNNALSPPMGAEQIDGIKPMDDVAVLAQDLATKDNLMYVGHLPFMERLVSFLIIGRIEPVVIKFQNGGIVCLDQSKETGGWFIKWTLMPQIG